MTALDYERLTKYANYCEFEPGTAYILMAMARKKDNDNISYNTEKLFRRTASNRDEVFEAAMYLAGIADQHPEDFRLYVSVNRRDALQAMFELRRRMDKWLECRLNGDRACLRDMEKTHSEFKSVLMTKPCRDTKHWLWDLDDVNAAGAARFREQLESHADVLLDFDTPNGYHFVTRGFDPRDFETDVPHERKDDDYTFIQWI